MRNIVKKILFILARLTILRYQPKIVGITGSVGKTSTKEAVAQVLSAKLRVRKSAGNYNNELGLPLTILNEKTQRKNVLGWLWLFVKVFVKLIWTNYPEVLVLEMAADRPGDLVYLSRIVGRLDVAVITNIGISHLEYFRTVNELAKEKLSLLQALDENSLAILNRDNPETWEGRTKTRSQVLSFGFDPAADIRASDFQVIKKDETWGTNFKVLSDGKVIPFFLPNVLGRPNVYAALAAAAVALRFKLNFVDISETLKHFIPPAGRLRLIPGIKRTWLIDDTYNAAPSSTVAALETFSQIAMNTRKIAVLGGMAELGPKTESGHREVGDKIIDCNIDLVFLVGKNAKIIEAQLEKRNFKGKIQWFETSDAVGIPLQNAMREGDTVLFKGSQSARMEKAVKEVMAQPLKAGEILVRQGTKWQDKL
jgi:UDP-N-acetylmuramoyl-tripeptide--D-alanyl-D-alanine ligase